MFVALAIVLVIVTSLVYLGGFHMASAEVKFSGAKNMNVVKVGQDVYIVFEAKNPTTNQEDIYLRSSHDGGKNYNSTNLSNGKVRLNGNGTIPADVSVENSYNPQIAADKKGDVYVAWNAKRGGNTYVVLASSDDGFKNTVTPVTNMTNINIPGTEPKLINDVNSGTVTLYYLTGEQGPQDPCKTRCG
jgi:hypothetical protein